MQVEPQTIDGKAGPRRIRRLPRSGKERKKFPRQEKRSTKKLTELRREVLRRQTIKKKRTQGKRWGESTRWSKMQPGGKEGTRGKKWSRWGTKRVGSPERTRKKGETSTKLGENEIRLKTRGGGLLKTERKWGPLETEGVAPEGAQASERVLFWHGSVHQRVNTGRSQHIFHGGEGL